MSRRHCGRSRLREVIFSIEVEVPVDGVVENWESELLLEQDRVEFYVEAIVREAARKRV
jgi:hypothetical protein